MTGIEVRGATPGDIGRELDQILTIDQENKYAFQVGLKDLDFDIDEDLLKIHGMTLPFPCIDQAERALRTKTITPSRFLEIDGTEHQVLVFDPRPIGFSGFMDCVTHSLAVTNQGLFEVGRYAAINMSAPNRFWQWFLHRRLAAVDEINDIEGYHSLTAEQFVEDVYQAFTQG